MSFLFRQIDTSSLVFFRIAFGILGFADVVTAFVYKHHMKGYFQAEDFHFRYYGFEWVHPMPEPFMSIFFILMLCAALCILVGKWYRYATLFFAFGFTYLFLLEKSFYLNHGYFFCLLSFILFFCPLDRAFSIRVLERPQDRLSTFPYWPLFILKVMMGIVYFFGGIAKLNPDWLNAQPLKIWLKSKGGMFLLGPIWKQEWVAYFMSYAGLLLDLLAPFLLLIKRTRWWILGFILFFHLTNLILFKIGIFPYLSVCLSLLYFSPDFPKRLGAYLQQKFQGLTAWFEKGKAFVFSYYSSAHSLEHKKLSYSKAQKQVISTLLILFIGIQLLLPLRHHYFKGNVAWTEEGHRYSWRMMLRHKTAVGKFTVVNLSNKERERINPGDYLTSRQNRKMLTHPDMILQFAHFLRDEYQKKGWEEVAVYAKIRAGLNGRKYQAYIDPEVDLAKEEWSFFEESEWIVPMIEDE